MSNQERSEQPVTVCLDCGGTKERPLYGSSGLGKCGHRFHSSAEQETEPSDEQKRMQVVSVWLSEYLSADWFYEPWEKVERAAASAAERYNEIKSEAADLRRQLAERDAVIEEVREWAIRVHDPEFCDEDHRESCNQIVRLCAASPSTVLESVRQEERERCAKIVCLLCRFSEAQYQNCDSARAAFVHPMNNNGLIIWKDCEASDIWKQSAASQEPSRDTNSPAI